MCDFHSIVVYQDGAAFHVASNSHSEAVAVAKRAENTPITPDRFVECEWNGDGGFPGVDEVTRGTANEKQRKTIERIYGALAELLSDPEQHAERMLFGSGIFSGDQYADVRWRVLIHKKCPKRLADKLATVSLHASSQTIKSLHPAITKIDGGFRVAEGYNITAPVLAQCGGVCLQQGATFTAPLLKKR